MAQPTPAPAAQAQLKPAQASPIEIVQFFEAIQFGGGANLTQIKAENTIAFGKGGGVFTAGPHGITVRWAEGSSLKNKTIPWANVKWFSETIAS